MKKTSYRSALFPSFAALLLGVTGVGACSGAPSDGVTSAEGREALSATSASALVTPIGKPVVPVLSPLANPLVTNLSKVLAAYAATSTSEGTVAAPGQELFGGMSFSRNGDGGFVWHDAITLDMLVGFQLATGNTAYQSTIASYAINQVHPLFPYPDYGCGNSGGINFNNCGNANTYNDDNLWWALAYIDAYDLFKTSQPAYAAYFLSSAEDIFQHTGLQWDSVPGCGGGLPQTAVDGPHSTYLNAITNELFFETAVKLYQRNPTAINVSGGTPWTNYAGAPGSSVAHPGPGHMTSYFTNDYLGWALAEYEWLKQYWWSAGSVPMGDGLDASCRPGPTAFTYNQAVVLGGLLDLASIDPGTLVSHGEADAATTILNYGFSIAAGAMTALSTSVATAGGTESILTEIGQSGESDSTNTCLGNGDCPAFKGIFMRYLARFVNGAQPQWGPYYNGNYQFTATATAFITNNANEIWANTAGGQTLPERWNVTPSGAYGMPQEETVSTSAIDGMLAAVNLNGPVPPPPMTLAGPGCAFPNNPPPVTVSCTPDAQNDPIYLFQKTPSGGWSFVTGYVPWTTTMAPVPEGGESTFLGCTYSSLYTMGVAGYPAPASWTSSNAPVSETTPGCDPKAQTDFYVAPTPPPAPPGGGKCTSAACTCVGVWTGTVCKHMCPCGGVYPNKCSICQ